MHRRSFRISAWLTEAVQDCDISIGGHLEDCSAIVGTVEQGAAVEEAVPAERESTTNDFAIIGDKFVKVR